MTNEEAIEIFSKVKELPCGWCYEGGDEFKKAINLAIEALKEIDGYNQAIKDITEHIQKMKSYYTDGIMCSMSESIIGENVCDDILKYLNEVEK